MIAVSKDVCIDKLDDPVDEYNNTYYIIIKMIPFEVKLAIKLVIILDYQNIETFL